MKKVLYVDLDDTIAQYSNAKAAATARYGPHPQSRYGFYQNLKPVPHAITAIEQLHNRDDFEVYILTAPSIHNPLSYAEKRLWVEHHLGWNFISRLIICADKSLLRGDILIDDHTSGKGQECFVGELIHFGSDKFPTWIRVFTYLTGKRLPLTGKRSIADDEI